jgi:tRNA-specific 2-thiouridylase
MIKNKKTVFVGVSGGVDSSVSVALLKDQGYNVVGVFIRTWTPDFIECTWRDERRDAMRICAHLGIPFLECDAEEAYKKGVADYMINEYKNGRTPNPDVMCNRIVKFGVFWDFAKKYGADFIATGHYAICKENFSESKVERKYHFSGVLGRGGWEPVPDHSKNNIFFQLCKSPDSSKDQSYFLWTLTQDDLSHTLFPIGHLNKKDVRKLAKKYKIPVAEKKDSQGVCFLGPLDMKEFLSHYIKKEKGDVLNEKGEIIGHHNGSLFFTLGERHSFIITEKTGQDRPYYVVNKDIKNNTITVSNKISSNLNKNNILKIERTNWIIKPEENKKYKAQIRYHGESIDCKIKNLEENKAEILLDKDTIVDSGQSIVVYENNICLGGGIVR